MSVQSYNEGTAETAHTDIGGVISGIESSLADLTGFVGAVKSNWDGDEQAQYSQIQDKWDTAAATVREILQSVHQALAANTGSVKAMRGRVKGALAGS